MPTLIIITLACVALYALYLVCGPFSFQGDSAADTIVNSIAFVLWVALSALLAVESVAVQPTLFGTVVCIIGATLAFMGIMLVVLPIFWAFFMWIGLSVIPAIERFFGKSKKV